MHLNCNVENMAYSNLAFNRIIHGQTQTSLIFYILNYIQSVIPVIFDDNNMNGNLHLLFYKSFMTVA